MQRSMLKWVGGKGRVIGHLRKVLPEADCLVEPFVGGGSVFLNTNYAQYRLSDSNPDLILLFQVASVAPDDLIEACQELWAKGNSAVNYNDIKADFNEKRIAVEDSIDRAAMFLYLNRHGFNGLCRYNQSGDYNVPYGKHVNPYLPREEIMFFAKKCREHEVLIRCETFEESIAKAPAGSVIYADPPYVPSTKTAAFAQYHKEAFNQHHHRLLAKLLKSTTERGCKVVLSNSDTLLTRDIYYGFNWTEVDVGRYLAATANTRGTVKELIGVLS